MNFRMKNIRLNQRPIIALCFCLFVSTIAMLSCGDSPTEPTVAANVVPMNGLYYRKDVGDTLVSPTLEFKVTDKNGGVLAGQTVHFSLIEGDGQIKNQSAQTLDSGIVRTDYYFTGELPYAVVRAKVNDAAQVDIIIRESVIRTGADAQAQFIRLDDDWGTIKAYNGEPDNLVVPNDYWIIIADYEASLGFVVILNDDGQDSIASNSETINYLIVNDNDDSDSTNDFKGKTVEGIGIGSLYGDVVAVYGPDSARVFDITFWRYEWPNSVGLTVYTDYHQDVENQDTFSVREIHISSPSGVVASPAPKSNLEKEKFE